MRFPFQQHTLISKHLWAASFCFFNIKSSEPIIIENKHAIYYHAFKLNRKLLPKVEPLENQISQAVQAIKAKDFHTARKILAALLKQNPKDEQAWLFLAVCVEEPQQKRDCLQRVLAINPHNEHALRAMAKLSTTSGQAVDTLPPAKRETQSGFFNFLDLIISLLFRLPIQFYFIIFAFLLVIGGVAYTKLNTDFFGLTSPDLAGLTVLDQYKTIQDDQGANWEVTYEKSKDTVFQGYVRHISINHISKFPFLTHDILITTGDFADPDLVYTNVTNHHFYWQSLNKDYPQGTINLLHVVPENEDIYQQLLRIRNGDTVSISGREILRIDAFDSQDKNLGWWKDDGCNTTLVKEVILDNKQ